MNVPSEEYTQVRNYMNASRELYGWISGARVLALLKGPLDSGVLRSLRTKSTPEQPATVTNIDQPIIWKLVAVGWPLRCWPLITG